MPKKRARPKPTKKPTTRSRSASRSAARAIELTKKEFADTVGLSTRQVENLIVDGMPSELRGRRRLIPLSAFTWFLQHKLEQTEKTTPDYQKARARREFALAERAELQLERQRGNLLTVRQFEDAYEDALDRVKQQLVTLAPRLTARLAGLKRKEMAREIGSAVKELIERLYTAEDLAGDEAA